MDVSLLWGCVVVDAVVVVVPTSLVLNELSSELTTDTLELLISVLPSLGNAAVVD